ncbi:MAG TPA: 6-phosphogluconolactonase [Acidimicrobiales bacterium]|nr:6-phosphogluconolactonase [Acidimicrobiales bacterium]
MYGELRVVDDVADCFVSRVVDAWRDRPRAFFSLVVSGGDLARRCYEHLAAHARDVIDWSLVDIYWGDERLVPRRHPDSNELLVRQALVNRVPPIRGVFPMRVESTADEYDALVRAAAPFDVIHLGLGPDGHTASLFPQSAGLDAPIDRYVVDNEDPLGHNFHPRRTLTFAGFALGDLVLVTVDGEAKRDALARVRAGDPSAPASYVRAPRVDWLVGESAL